MILLCKIIQDPWSFILNSNNHTMYVLNLDAQRHMPTPGEYGCTVLMGYAK
jgi:hypothetical protein